MEFNSQLPEGWQQAIHANMRDSGVIKDVTDINTIVKMAIDGRNLAGDHIRIPGSEATPEARQNFVDEMIAKVPELMAAPIEGGDMSAMFEKMGRPKEATGYELGEIPDPIKAQFENITAKAFELGVSKDQMRGIANTLVGEYNSDIAQNKTAIEAEQADLKKHWGQTYESNLNRLSHFAKQTGFTDDFVSAIGNGMIEAKNMTALENIMDGWKGEGLEIGSQPGDPASGITPVQAEERLNEIMDNRESPYWDAGHPAHQATKDKVHELVTAAESGKKQTENEKFRESM